MSTVQSKEFCPAEVEASTKVGSFQSIRRDKMYIAPPIMLTIGTCFFGLFLLVESIIKENVVAIITCLFGGALLLSVSWIVAKHSELVTKYFGSKRNLAYGVVFVSAATFVFSTGIQPAPYYMFMPTTICAFVFFTKPSRQFLLLLLNLFAIGVAYFVLPETTAEHTFSIGPTISIGFSILVIIVAVNYDSVTGRHYWQLSQQVKEELRKSDTLLKEEVAKVRRNILEQERTRSLYQHQLEENEQRLAHLTLVNQERSQLAAAASSDLKEPLRNINSFIQLIDRRLTALNLKEGLEEYLYFVTDGASRMNAMVEDLLKYSSPDADVEPELVETNEIAKTIEVVLTDLLQRENAAIYVDTNMPVIMGHRIQVLQLFQNLISNGIKFKRPDTDPECHIGCRIGESFYEFYVTDNGIGIPNERLADIFGLFTRLHGKGTYEGTGIGLALCRRIVLEAGGEIWAESAEGEGTTFKFTWPIPIEGFEALYREASELVNSVGEPIE